MVTRSVRSVPETVAAPMDQTLAAGKHILTR